jgi:hypothetical protein
VEVAPVDSGSVSRSVVIWFCRWFDLLSAFGPDQRFGPRAPAFHVTQPFARSAHMLLGQFLRRERIGSSIHADTLSAKRLSMSDSLCGFFSSARQSAVQWDHTGSTRNDRVLGRPTATLERKEEGICTPIRRVRSCCGCRRQYA